MKRTSLLRWAGAGLLAAGVALSMASPATAGADTSARSMADLHSAQVMLDKAAATRPSTVTSWYVDAASRSLVVEVHGADSAVANWASSLGAGAVRIQHVREAYKPLWNIINGQAVTTTAGARCSAGFNARSSSGARYVIDAGHCGNLGGTWSGTGGTLGTVAASSFPTNDYSAINVSSSSAVQTGLVDRYSAGSDVRVTGARSATTGLAVCRSGSTSGWHCGTVTATNTTVCYAEGCVSQMIRTNVCAEPGDSGGSLVTNPGSGTTVQAVGLTSGGSGNCSSGGTTFFQPITEPLSTYGLTLVTG
jgi:streptogrisin C